MRILGKEGLLSVTAVALPTVCVALLSGWLALNEHRRQALAELQTLTGSVASAIDLKLESYKAALRTLADSADVEPTLQLAEIRMEAERVGHVFGGWFVVATGGETFKFLLDTLAGPDNALPVPEPRARVPEIAAADAESSRNGWPSVTDAFMGRAASRPIIGISVPLKAGPTPTPFLYFVFDTIHLSEILTHRQLADGDVAYVSDGSNRIIARSLDPDPYMLAPLEPEQADWMYGRDLGARELEAADDGSPLLQAFRRLEAAPRWVVTIERPSTGPLATVIASTWPAILTALVFAVMVGLTTLVNRQLAKERQLAHTRSEAAETHAELEEIRAADEKKSNMIAVLSHEMRAPLVSLLGALDLMRAEGVSRAQADHLYLAGRDGEILLRLIDDVLELARLGAGKLRLDAAPFDPAAVARDVVAIIGPEAQRRSIQVSVNVAPGLPRLIGDEHRIRQVLLNFATNAVKFSDGGRIDVSVVPLGLSPDGRTVEFAVRDTGVGIAPEDIPKLFTDFGMLDSSRPESRSGAGLGLAISRRLVQAMGGQMDLSSRVGEGSRFWFRLTLPEVPDSAEAGSGDEPLPDNSLKGLRVLVAEDQELVRLLTKRKLEAAGAEVETAVDGLQAVLIAERTPVDLILMDLMMPKLDGASAAQRIRSGRGPSADARIVGLTAHQQPESTLILSRLAMDACLEKPFDLKALLALLTLDRSAEPAPASAGSGSEAVLDQAAVTALRAAAPARFVSAAFERFADEIDDRVREIVVSEGDGHLDQVRQTAHKLAGLCLTMGGQALALRLRMIANAAQSGDQNRLRIEMLSLEPLAKETRAAAVAAARDFATA